MRLGAGRPKNAPLAAWLAGHPGKRGPKSSERPSFAPTAPEGPVNPPQTLTTEERRIWDELAPHAIAAHTLTPASVAAFTMLCRAVELERLAAGSLRAGGPDHRGMLQRVENLMARFRLVPDGKPVIIQEAPADEWAEFDNVVSIGKKPA